MPLPLLALPLLMVGVAAPPPDPIGTPPVVDPPPAPAWPRRRVEVAAGRWTRWYWRQEPGARVSRLAVTCGPAGRRWRCFVTYRVEVESADGGRVATDMLDVHAGCRVGRVAGFRLEVPEAASGMLPGSAFPVAGRRGLVGCSWASYGLVE